MNVMLPAMVIAVMASFFALPHNAQGHFAGSTIGSDTAIYTFGGATPSNLTSFEATISSNSSFVIQTVLIETNSSAESSVSIREWRIYSSEEGSPFVHSDHTILQAGSDGEVRSMTGLDILPLGVPQNGSMGIVLEALGLRQGDQVRVTFVYTANAGSAVSAEMSGALLPFYVTEQSTVINSTGLEINDSFVNPEIHCELCTQVQKTGAEEKAQGAYTADATDLTGATKFAFWAAGGSGGENVTFKVAGSDGTYANSTTVTLGSEWKWYEVDLAGASLTNVTHLFGFEVNDGQTFYVKGAAYY